MVDAPPGRRRVTEAELDAVREAVQTIAGGDSRIVAVYLYGSAARGEEAADIDLAVLAERSVDAAPTPTELESMAATIESAAAPKGLPIDLRRLNGATPRFSANVLRDGVVLYERDRPSRCHAEAEIMTRWGDFRPVWEGMRARMLQRWAGG